MRIMVDYFCVFGVYGEGYGGIGINRDPSRVKTTRPIPVPDEVFCSRTSHNNNRIPASFFGIKYHGLNQESGLKVTVIGDDIADFKWVTEPEESRAQISNTFHCLVL